MAMIRLYHGTDMASATDIHQNGLDAVKAASYNGSLTPQPDEPTMNFCPQVLSG